MLMEPTERVVECAPNGGIDNLTEANQCFDKSGKSGTTVERMGMIMSEQSWRLNESTKRENEGTK